MKFPAAPLSARHWREKGQQRRPVLPRVGGVAFDRPPLSVRGLRLVLPDSREGGGCGRKALERGSLSADGADLDGPTWTATATALLKLAVVASTAEVVVCVVSRTNRCWERHADTAGNGHGNGRRQILPLFEKKKRFLVESLKEPHESPLALFQRVSVNSNVSGILRPAMGTVLNATISG